MVLVHKIYCRVVNSLNLDISSDNEGSGQQCCYDDGGELVVGPPGGGTVDLYAPTSWTSTLSHFTHDVLPFIYCCKGAFSNCDLYYQKRPSDNGKRYILKPPGTHACTSH